jgi:hypothetical protein
MSGDAVQDVPVVQATRLYLLQNVPIRSVTVAYASISTGRTMVVDPFGDVLATLPDEIVGYDLFFTVGT